MSDTPEKDKYLKWYKKEQEENGLISARPTFNFDWYDPENETIKAPEGVTEEDIYKELNDINDAMDRGDYTVVAEVRSDGTWVKEPEFF